VQKLHYCVPGKALKDGLRFFNDDNSIKDIIYYYFYGEKTKVYVEYYSEDENEDEDGDGGDEDGDEQTTTEGGEVRDPIQASN